MFYLAIYRNEIPDKQTLEHIVHCYSNWIVVQRIKVDRYVYGFSDLGKATDAKDIFTYHGFNVYTDFQ